MDEKDFQLALTQSRQELASLMEQREALDHRIAKLRLNIGSLIQLSGESVIADDEHAPLFGLKGLSEACREVLTAFKEPLTVNEVIDKLKILGYNVGQYANLAGTVQTTLRRMTTPKDADVVEVAKGGNKAYQLRQHVKPLGAGLRLPTEPRKKVMP